LLVLPRGGASGAAPSGLYATASAVCARRRAILLLEPPEDWRDAKAVLAGFPALAGGVALENAALYLPRLVLADGSVVGPAGAVAGAILRTDRLQGPWTAPAGPEVTLQGVGGLTWAIDHRDQEQLNRQGINVIRLFGNEPQLWGARTHAGAAALASEWKYLPVRRLALLIEQSLEDGLRWVAFEANGEPLWAAVRPAAEAMLHDLFRAGAFAGGSERDAWFLRCDATTMTPADIAAGRLKVEIGFAAVRPAEFIVLRLGLWTREHG
jgi:phage tail sheath protein FI